MNRSDIGDAASQLTRSQFAEELSKYLRLTPGEIESLFPSQADRDELAKLTELVLGPASVNRQRAALIRGIPDVASAVLKLLRHMVIPG
jgi:hypothetical protein